MRIFTKIGGRKPRLVFDGIHGLDKLRGGIEG